jgi:hypothetical protein
VVMAAAVGNLSSVIERVVRDTQNLRSVSDSASSDHLKLRLRAVGMMKSSSRKKASLLAILILQNDPQI